MSSMPSALAAPSADHEAATLAYAGLIAFAVQARAEPGVMPRVVELFAKRGLVPQAWRSAVMGNLLTIEVEMGGLGRELADYLARCMRQIVGVETVLTSETTALG